MLFRVRSAAALLSFIFLFSFMAAAEDAVPLAELPPLVLRALRDTSAKLISARKEEKNDYVHYYVKISDAAGEREIEVLENGTVVPADTRNSPSK